MAATLSPRKFEDNDVRANIFLASTSGGGVADTLTGLGFRQLGEDKTIRSEA
jgi:hypothetical protein